MRDSFLDDRNFPLHAMAIVIGLPAIIMTVAACTQPSTPEEKAESDERRAAWIKEDMVTLSPRPGVECYVIRGSSSSSPRTMSCVVLPTEIK